MPILGPTRLRYESFILTEDDADRQSSNVRSTPYRSSRRDMYDAFIRVTKVVGAIASWAATAEMR